MSEKTTTQDPALYHEMAQPFETPEAANDAISAFYEDVRGLRRKHKIRDVLIVVFDSATYGDGKVGEFMNTIHMGSELHALSMAAYSYGQQQADHREMIAKIVATKNKL